MRCVRLGWVGVCARTESGEALGAAVAERAGFFLDWLSWVVALGGGVGWGGVVAVVTVTVRDTGLDWEGGEDAAGR